MTEHGSLSVYAAAVFLRNWSESEEQEKKHLKSLFFSSQVRSNEIAFYMFQRLEIDKRKTGFL